MLRAFDSNVGGALVYWASSLLQVTDNSRMEVMVTYDPVSGSVLGAGIHDINVMAVDGSGNQASCTFQVEVQGNCLV